MNSQKLLQLIERRHNQELELLNLADSMVSAVTNMNAQNYEILMQTRQEFKEKLHEALDEAMNHQMKAMPFAY